MRISNKWKAVIGGLGALVASLGTVAADNVIGLDEAGMVISAAIAFGVLVYGAVYAKGQKTDAETDRETTESNS